MYTLIVTEMAPVANTVGILTIEIPLTEDRSVAPMLFSQHASRYRRGGWAMKLTGAGCYDGTKGDALVSLELADM